MADYIPLMKAIQNNDYEIAHKALADDDFNLFMKKFQGIVEQASNPPVSDQMIYDRLMALLDEYKTIEANLREKEPDLLDSDPSTDKATEQPASAEMVTTSTPKVNRVPTTKHDSSVSGSKTHHIRREDGVVEGSQESDKPGQWTPETTIHILKEIVTAVLGMALVGVTLYMAINTFGLNGDTTRLNNAKDLLQLLLSLSGVVIGYYFGRVPADARAEQAQKQTASAVTHTERVNAKAEQVARSFDQLAPTVDASVRSGGVSDEDLKRFQIVREEVRQLADLSRQHWF